MRIAESGDYSQEASTLHLPVGEFPQQFMIEGVAGVFDYNRQASTHDSIVYGTEAGLTATIFND